MIFTTKHRKYNLNISIMASVLLAIIGLFAYNYNANANHNIRTYNTHYTIDSVYTNSNYILVSNLYSSYLIYYPLLLAILNDNIDLNSVLLAQNLNTNRNEETQYFDDLNIMDENIYEKYFYKKGQFRFLKPPDIDRNSMIKRQLQNINPNDWIEHFAIDEDEYRNNFNINVKSGEYLSTEPIEPVAPPVDTNKNQLGGGRRPTPPLPTTDNNTSKKSNFNPNARSSYNITEPYTKSLDQYLAERKEKIQSKIYDSLISTYDMKKAMSRSDLASLLGQGTGLSIPLPPNPILNIFGKPEIAINVNGQVNLTLGWRLDVQNLGTASVSGQVQSSPIFKQDIRVDVNARIGDKLKFNINHNTRSFFEFDKKFKIGYEGYEDDIIKKVEVGNISFELPSTLISAASELFGVGATFQFGPLWLRTAVSQKKGQKAMIDVTGGTSKQQFSVRAWNYARNHFFLDTAYKPVYNEYFKYSTPIPPKSASHLRIKQIEVWEASTDLTNPHVAQGIAIADLQGIQRKMGQNYPDEVKHAPMQTGFVEKARFSLLDSNQYVVDRTLGTLTLKNFREDRYYAVSYRIEGPTTDTTDDITFGYFSNQIAIGSSSSGGVSTTTDTMILKLIYRPNLLPAYKQLWERQMRNIYNVGMNNVNLTDTKIEVWYTRKTNDSTEMLDGANDKLATILRIDRVTNSTGSEPPDGLIDINNPAIFNPQTGELTFPHSEPFANGLVEYFESIGNKELANQYVYRQIYDTTIAIAQKNTAKDRFLISGEITGRASNSISLNAYNLSPGSVKVYLDGALLREYDDYTVEYSMGRLTIKNPRALLPNANVRVEYEQRDVFMTSTKTFFGLRADYELFKNRWMTATLGATAVRYSQAVISDRARLGDEPIANTMFGFDINLNADAPWLTKALDYLPFYDTKAPSSINLFAEAAMVMPTPNRVRSEITSDRNEPVAEVDNFESVTRSTTLSTSFMSWTHSSSPVNSLFYDTTFDKSLSEIEQGKIANGYRGRMWWWQYSYPRVPRPDPYPENQSYQSGYQNNISALYIYFDPAYRGIYNENEQYLDAENPNFLSYPAFYTDPVNKEKIWGGMMRILSTGSTNFDNDNVEFLDVMIRINDAESTTKVYFDIGMISEDVIANGYGDTEDGIMEDNPLPNGIIDIGEDVGYDARSDSLEKILYPPLLAAEDDPARDNFYFDFGKDDYSRGPADYTRYNLPQGNSGNDMGAFPDKEMLNNNNGQTLSTDNAYFTYELNLDTDPNNNPQIVGGNPDAGWFQYRIPIRKPTSKVGDPQFSNMQYVRFRVEGGRFACEVVDWKLVGNYWQRSPEFEERYDPNDSVLQVSYVNLWENSKAPDYYSMPPGVQAPRQMGSLDYSVNSRLNEQSLSMSVKNLLWGEERMAVKVFAGQDLDFFNYKKLKYFIHGDGSMPMSLSSATGSSPKAYSFIRFGIDSGNYYEYRRPITQDWQEIEIDLSQLTAIKQVRDTQSLSERIIFPVPNDPTAHFAIKGSPILTKVKFVGIGIANPSNNFQELTTTMWIDELRLLSPESSNDWAGVANFSANLADLGTINFVFSNYEPNFHALEERYGDRNQTRDWSVVLTGNLEKFAPKNFSAMQIPISYSHLEKIINPRYVASNDIELAAAANAAYNDVIEKGGSASAAEQAANDVRKRSSSLTVQDSWSLTGVKTGIPIDHWLISETINRITTSYSYSQIYERSPIYEERFGWVWRFSANYNLPIPDLLVVKPMSLFGAVSKDDNSRARPATVAGNNNKPSAGWPANSAYREWKINFLPSNITLLTDMTRKRQTEQTRIMEQPSPVIREFTANRGANFNWKFSQGGILSPTLDYKIIMGSTFVPWELDPVGRQRTGGELADIILLNNGRLIDFGMNTTHQQDITINIKPLLPNIWNLNRIIDITGSYTSSYRWQDPLQQDPTIRDASRRSSVNGSLRGKVTLKLNQILNTRPMSSVKTRANTKDTTKSTSNASSIIKSIFVTLLNWDNVDFNFNRTTASQNVGLFGGTGLDNIWVSPFNSKVKNGASMSYQLGLVSEPHSTVSLFPFSINRGVRPFNSVLLDNYNESNTIDIKTGRTLWEGARIDLNWKLQQQWNRNWTIDVDAIGNKEYSNIMSQDNLNRTFLSVPDFFGLHLFGNPVEKIVALFESKRAVLEANFNGDSLALNTSLHGALNDAFYEGLEMLSFTGGALGKILPAVNWTFRWEGLEKWPIWKGMIRRLSIEHNYTSTYAEIGQRTDMGRVVQTQTMNSGFNPLFGVTASFDEKLFKGVFTASIKWSETNNYSATTASGAIISLQQSTDITANASYIMKGFSMAFLGLNLKNDFELSFLFTYKKNNTGTFDVMDPKSYSGDNATGGRTLTGNTQIIVEPRARYQISQMITAALFFRYEGTFNEGAANPGFFNTQIGLDIMLNISGGR